MENNKKDLAKVALAALILAAASPAAVSANTNAIESQGTFLAAGCGSCGAKKGQIADNSCGARRAYSPQNASCGAQRGTIAESSCGARRGNNPYAASSGAQRSYTADNASERDMYNPSTNSYQSTPPADHPYGQQPGGAHRGPDNQSQMRNPTAMNDANQANSSTRRPNDGNTMHTQGQPGASSSSSSSGTSGQGKY